MCYLFVHSERQREGGERVHLFVHKPWRRQRVCLFVCLLRLFVFFIRSSATATARLFIRLSTASVCFSLFHAPRRRRVYLFVCPWRLFVFFIRLSATATARLFIRLSAASVCFSLFWAQRNAASAALPRCRRVCSFFVCSHTMACSVCLSVYSCMHTALNFFGGWVKWERGKMYNAH